MHATNELSCYRYAAIVHVKGHDRSQQASKVSESRVVYRFSFDNHNLLGHSLVSRPLWQQKHEKAKGQVLKTLQETVPSYMIPRELVVLDKMPLNQNSKVDRMALKKSLLQSQIASATAAAHPSPQSMSEVELQMQKIWRETLNKDPATIMLEDNFFLLGGDSFTTMKLVAMCHLAGLGLTVGDIIMNPELRHAAGLCA